MAFKLPSIKLGKSKAPQAVPPATAGKPSATPPAQSATQAAKTPAAARGQGAPFKASAAGLPLIGHLPVARQLQNLGILLVTLLAFMAFLVFIEGRQAAFGTAYVAAAGEMRMLSQRIAKASQQAMQGNADAFKQLLESRDRFSLLVKTLNEGGNIGEVPVQATSDKVRPVLEALVKEWDKTEKNAGIVLDQQKNLAGLGSGVRQINSNNPALLDLAEQVQALKLQSAASPREISYAGQMVMLTQRVAKNANTMLAGDVIDPEVAFLLGKDSNTFREILDALSKGSETLRIAPSKDPDTVEKLIELQASFKDFQAALAGILGNLQRLVNAKAAAFRIFKDSEALLTSANDLASAYGNELAGRTGTLAIILLVGLLVLGTLGLMLKVYLDDSGARREEAEQQRLEAERQNKINQAAILRLMNEMSELADGNLTVVATVSGEITGAIADSVNYTIEELRGLVGRITTAAAQVTTATEAAQQTSSQLLAAAEKQSKEIQDTSASVVNMTRAITQVSQSAAESANVARQSLAAAQKGAQAVQNSIAGMNEIREQIQDTAKRIKRLGESSQEIGEIVELISDITEQTNVLALNAAIQAASAGEAGRGFTVVAEEVQRLAERSGEATKQIGAIVKTIQTDTQDAVAAMEKSTQGVVAGAKLSDNAGQALSEIDRVSRQLAELIERISATTQQQAKAAGAVAMNMQDILTITQLTTEGTKKTAVSIGQLAGLAQELKGSVANFKI